MKTVDEIQEEIRKRILLKARRHAGNQNLEEATRATLDAMEEIVDLPRDEMERIAKTVLDELKENSEFSPQEPSSGSGKKLKSYIFPWTSILALIAIIYLLRRGAPWYMMVGLLLIAAGIGIIIKKNSNNNQD
ncbi:hypothetical protein KKA14_20535 [bacterium]|nr:hypothetical protein [bacterium]